MVFHGNAFRSGDGGKLPPPQTTSFDLTSERAPHLEPFFIGESS
jgi:hypothetical protein